MLLGRSTIPVLVAGRRGDEPITVSLSGSRARTRTRPWRWLSRYRRRPCSPSVRSEERPGSCFERSLLSVPLEPIPKVSTEEGDAAHPSPPPSVLIQQRSPLIAESSLRPLPTA